MRTASDLINGPLRDFTAPDVFNPWRDADEALDLEPTTAAQWRRIRLEQHFDCTPKYLLIGEAPGYQGCHFSGVPFTNERLLMDGAIPRIRMNLRITRRESPFSEPSATIVWKQLYQLGIASETVMWNAFAWHPHKRGDLWSNRPPTRAEVENGWNVLRGVLTLFAHARVIAVGNVAAETLKRLDVSIAAKVQHPARGGAPKFRAQLAAICQREAA